MIICIEFKSNEQFIQLLTTRLLQNIYKGIDFLSLIVLVYNTENKIDSEALNNQLRNSLKSIVDIIEKEEEHFPK